MQGSWRRGCGGRNLFIVIIVAMVLGLPASADDPSPEPSPRPSRTETERPAPEAAPARPEASPAPAERRETPDRPTEEPEPPAERPDTEERPAPREPERPPEERPERPVEPPVDADPDDPAVPEVDDEPDALVEPESEEPTEEEEPVVEPVAEEPIREVAAPARTAPTETPTEVDPRTVRREARERRTDAISQSIDVLVAEDAHLLPPAQLGALIGQVAQGARVDIGAFREEAAEARLTLEHLQNTAARVRRDRQTVPRQVRLGQIPTLGAANRWEALQATNLELQEALDAAFSERIRLLSDIPKAEEAAEKVATLSRTAEDLFDEALHSVLADAEEYLRERHEAMQELLDLYNEQAAVATEAYDESSRYAEELSSAMVAARYRALTWRTDETISAQTFKALGTSIAALPGAVDTIVRRYHADGRPPATMPAYMLRVAVSVVMIAVFIILWGKLPGWFLSAFGVYHDPNARDAESEEDSEQKPDLDTLRRRRHAELLLPLARALLLAGLAALAVYLWGLPREWSLALLAVIGIWAGYFALLAIIRELLAPRHDELRVVPVETRAAVAIFRLLRALALWSAIMLSLTWALSLLDYPHEDVLVLLSVIHVVGLAGIAAWIIYGQGGPAEFTAGADDATAGRPVRRIVTTAVPVALGLIAAIALLKAVGYVNLGGYLARIVYVNLPLLSVALILQRQIRVSLREESRLRRWLRIALWAVAGVVQIPVFELRWHHAVASYEFLHRPLFEVGESEVSIFSIIRAIIAIFLAWLVAKLLRDWLSDSERVGTHLSEGAQYALSSLTFYLILIAGILWAMLVGGFPLNALTVLAGMAGIGLGFGLQDIVRNFFAGLILLIERPIAVGDYIEVEETWGRVTSISLRTTDVRTQDNVHILIPNGEIIAEHLTNLSHQELTMRVRIPIGVSYDADIDHVLDVLVGIAERHEQVADFPEPSARLVEFGDNSIDLMLMAWVSDPAIHRAVAVDINLEIWRTLKAEGIEIPFPQRDLHLRSVEAPLGIEGVDPAE